MSDFEKFEKGLPSEEKFYSLLEIFRNNSLKNYGLCPSHYLSSPALIWDAQYDHSRTQTYSRS